MWQGDGLELPAIELVTGKAGNLRVHSSLTVEGLDHVCTAGDPTVESLEEGVAAVGQSDGSELRALDFGLLFGLHDDGGQLLVVSNHDKLPMVTAEEGQDLRFEYL